MPARLEHRDDYGKPFKTDNEKIDYIKRVLLNFGFKPPHYISPWETFNAKKASANSMRESDGFIKFEELIDIPLQLFEQFPYLKSINTKQIKAINLEDKRNIPSTRRGVYELIEQIEAASLKTNHNIPQKNILGILLGRIDKDIKEKIKYETRTRGIPLIYDDFYDYLIDEQCKRLEKRGRKRTCLNCRYCHIYDDKRIMCEYGIRDLEDLKNVVDVTKYVRSDPERTWCFKVSSYTEHQFFWKKYGNNLSHRSALILDEIIQEKKEIREKAIEERIKILEDEISHEGYVFGWREVNGELIRSYFLKEKIDNITYFKEKPERG